MKNFFALMLIAASSLTATSAFAYDNETDAFIVPYGDDWKDVPYCGGQTRLTCDDVPNAKIRNRCQIEFRGVSCQHVKMYVGNDFYPTWNTVELPIGYNMYIDYNRMSIFNKNAVNVFLSTSKYDTSQRVRLQYQFDY